MKTEEIKKKLESHLKEIGWRLKFCGCGHYALVDHKNKVTDFHYFAGALRIESASISVVEFNLGKCKIETSEDKACVTIGATDNVFINLYNFTK